jgi:hypothetical protein
LAGLLTSPVFERLPGNASGLLAQKSSFGRRLQQRVLFLIFTGFPFHPVLPGTITVQK